MSDFTPTANEIEVLEILAGEREGRWGAAIGAALEFLSEAGLCTRGPNYQITEAGRIAPKKAQGASHE